MNKQFRNTITALVVSLVSVISLFFINGEKYQTFLTAALLLLLLVALICFLKYVMSAKEEITAQESKHRDEIAITLAKLEKSESVRNRYREVVGELENQLKAKNILKDDPASKMLESFRNNVVSPYIAALKDVEMPLSPEAKQNIIDMTIDLAMKAVDVADASDWNINNRPEQKLNLEVVSQVKTIEQAYENAKQITDNPTVTPKWIRALHGSLKDIVSETCKIIYSGYKR